MNRNLRYGDLLSTVHEMVETNRNSFVYEMRSLLNNKLWVAQFVDNPDTLVLDVICII